LALWCSAGIARADENKAAPCDLGRNAALTYWRAFAVFPEMTKEEDNIVASRPGNEPKSTLEQRADLVKRWSSSLQLMHEAATISECDWGVNYEKEGPDALLPHLGKARSLARAATFRARYFWEIGRRKDAAEDIRAAVIMARQVGKDGSDTLIAALVQMTLESTALNSAALLLTDRDSADIFSNALGDFLDGSAVPMVDKSILFEKKVFIPWFRNMISSEGTKAIDKFVSLGVENADVKKLRALSAAEILRCLDQVEEQYRQIAERWALPYPEFVATGEAFLEKIRANGNPLTNMLIGSLTGIRSEDEKFYVKWAMFRAAIEIRREGESALNKVLNPADGKPFLYTDLGGGAFELKSALDVRGPLAMTFGQPPAK